MKTSISLLLIIIAMGSSGPFAFAQSPSQSSYQESVFSIDDVDSAIAPIALYPDALLTHILIASTTPLDVLQANEWRQNNRNLNERQVLSVVENFSWSPSVKAITPMTDILNSMSEDLAWLQILGEVMLADEALVLERVQVLRQEAYVSGNLTTNKYQHVYYDDHTIVIESATPQLIYVPYYNPNVVFARHWHAGVVPFIWAHSPRHHFHFGRHWSRSYRLSASFYFGDIRWRARHLVVSAKPKHFYNHKQRAERKRSKNFQRWIKSKKYKRAQKLKRSMYRTEGAHRKAVAVKLRQPNGKQKTIVSHKQGKQKAKKKNTNQNSKFRNHKNHTKVTKGNKKKEMKNNNSSKSKLKRDYKPQREKNSKRAMR